MLLRRLKFLAWLAAILIIVLGGSYLFAPQWLMRRTSCAGDGGESGQAFGAGRRYPLGLLRRR
jgi:hypothetical protein